MTAVFSCLRRWLSSRHARLTHGVRAIATLVALGACEHPVAVLTPHVEAADVVLRDASGAVAARTFDNRRWEGGPLVASIAGATPYTVELLDFEGRALTGVEGRADVELRLEAEDDGRVLWEPLRGRGMLHGLTAGATRVRFLVWHGTHADLATPWLATEVRADAAPAAPPTSR